MRGEKAIPRLLVALPLLGVVLIAAAAYFYEKNIHRYFEEQSQRIKREHTAAKERESEAWVHQATERFARSEGALEEKIRNRLRTRVQTVHEMATQIDRKYADRKTARQQIKNALSRMAWDGQAGTVRITDYEGGNVLPGTLGTNQRNIAGYSDADGRAVILEEIQKVRRHGEGFIASRTPDEGAKQITFVKNFGRYGWYFAFSVRIDRVISEFKGKTRELLGELPAETGALRAVFDENGAVYVSQGMGRLLDAARLEQLRGALDPQKRWHRFEREGVRLYAAYFVPLGWYVLHGFETASLDAEIARQRLWLNEKTRKELETLYAGLALLGLLAFVFSVIFGWRIRSIIGTYKQKPSGGKTERESSRAPMVAADEVVGMLSNQWKQPFKKINALLTQIEKTHARDELTPELLGEKVKEGRAELLFMTHNMQAAQSALSSAGESEELSVAEAVDTAADMVAKTLEAHGICLGVSHHTYNHLTLDRTMLIQLLLSLMIAAKNILLRHGARKPMLTVSTGEDERYMLVEVCCNAGQADELADGSGGMELHAARDTAEACFGGVVFVENRGEGVCISLKIAKSLVL